MWRIQTKISPILFRSLWGRKQAYFHCYQNFMSNLHQNFESFEKFFEHLKTSLRLLFSCEMYTFFVILLILYYTHQESMILAIYFKYNGIFNPFVELWLWQAVDVPFTWAIYVSTNSGTDLLCLAFSLLSNRYFFSRRILITMKTNNSYVRDLLTAITECKS